MVRNTAPNHFVAALKRKRNPSYAVQNMEIFLLALSINTGMAEF